ncbi:hypothetical protein BC833DRAFT_217378 [Globomyces pollinis-pini]|nr:hypothetical protein BC833DRAFT_217378 [Globomyces pollinis-pini]
MTEISRPTRSFAHHTHLIHLLKQDKIDLANLPNDLKVMIMEQSIARLQHYDPLKVITRSDHKYSVLDAKQITALKKKRLESIYNRGFYSDPKELYKPLGDPALDTETLLYDTLQIDTKGLNKNNKFESEAQKDATQQKKQQAKMKMKFREVPKRHTNGFKYIKEKLAKSNNRIGSVKFGVPFTDVCELDNRDHTYDTTDQPKNENRNIDWNNLEIDEDRKTFFLNIYNKYLTAQKEPEDKPKALKTPQSKRNAKSPILQDPGTIKLSRKQIETALQIKREDHTADTTDRFFTTRDNFYEQRTRLNYRLAEDLDRLDFERKINFQRKVRVFELSKKGQCIDDLTTMRCKANEERRNNRKHLIDSHPWYNELINKVVVLNGVQREVTPHESVILEHLRGLIEDQVRFTKHTFLHLIRLLPTRDFLKDEVQRIIRFVKSHETITERDYLEIVEQAGHSVTF